MALFTELGLSEPILRALSTEGYTVPTPIQAQSIPIILSGRDMVGCAQTGTGKTAAFSLPILERLHNSKHPAPKGDASQAHHGHWPRRIRCLVLTPTRELAIQIGDSLATYGKHLPLRYTVIFGGVGQWAQTNSLRNGVDILVATPGRLLDLMNQGFVDLRQVECFVLDEADRMLDMGFVHDVRKVIAKIPDNRQTLLFSATMPEEIVKLSKTILRDPARVEVTPVSSTAEKIAQAVYFVSKTDKKKLLVHLLQDSSWRQVLVFSRTKHGSDKIVSDLEHVGIEAGAIHGNKSQNARQRALNAFKDGKLRVLVATDIAARGIDIDELAHVINYDLSNEAETYVHRIGRTGRAGASGLAVSFCDGEERAYLRDIEKLIGKKIPVVSDHPFPTNDQIALSEAQAAEAAKKAPRWRGRSPWNASAGKTGFYAQPGGKKKKFR